MGGENNKKNKLDLSKRHNDTEGAFINNAPILNDVSKDIKKNITTDVYKKLQKAKTKEEHKIHHAQASEKAKQGAYVFEFRTAGSGNNQWNKIYRGFNGHNEDIKLTPLEKEELEQEKSYYDEIASAMKQKYRLDFNNNISETDLADKLEKEYGKPLYMDDKGNFCKEPDDNTRILSGVRIKEDPNQNKTIANLSGPLGTIFGFKMGAANSGDYSIDNLKEYMLKLADNWLLQVKKQKEINKDNNPIYIYMQGHSRGAVATSEASGMIQHLINTQYKELKDQIHINVRLYDPVPGTGSHSNHAEINHKADKFTVHGEKEASGLMNGNGKNQNDLTVLYSIHSNHDLHFKPMSVLGAKRVILSPRDHDMGIYDVAETNGKRHKKGYINGADGEEYRGTGLHDLKEGLFLLDENNILIEIKNKQEAHRFLDSVLKGKAEFNQKTRHLTMYKVVDEWFSRHKEDITPNDTRYAPIKAINEDIAALKEYISGKDTDRFVDPAAMKSRTIASLFAHTQILNKANKDPYRISQDAFDKYKSMTADSRYVDNIENNQKYQQFIKDLTDDEIKEIIDNPSSNKIVEKYNSFISTIIPDTGLDELYKNLNKAQENLANVLNSEYSDNPDDRMYDPENAKKYTVAHIIANSIISEAAKKDIDSNKPGSKERYDSYIKSAESEVYNLVKDPDFIRFFEKMSPEEMQELATGGRKAADKAFEGYIKVIGLSEKEKTIEDVKLMGKYADIAFSNKAFFKERLDENGNFLPEYVTEELKNIKGTTHISLRICEMLKDGHSIEDILDPYRLADKKSEYAGKDYESSSKLEEIADISKKKLKGERPVEDGESTEGLTQEYIKAEEGRIARADLCKLGMQKALDYLGKKMSTMKSMDISELTKPENRNILAVNHFLKDLSREIEHTAPKYPVDKNTKSFVDPEVENLVKKQGSFDKLFSSTVAKYQKAGPEKVNTISVGK